MSERAVPLPLTTTLAAALVAVLLFGLLTEKPTHAATTFTVNSTGDQSDADLVDDPNVCDTDLLTPRNQCTLRAAIEEANDTDGADTINFNIDPGFAPGCASTSKVCTISISANSPLPSIDEPVAINGYTQTGATPNTKTKPGITNAAPKIELKGPGIDPNSVGSMNGLNINAPNVVVKGLVINSFSLNGINISGNGAGAVIEGNFLGTDPETDFHNLMRFNGVNIGANDVTIGGTTPQARNLISGSNSNGVNLSNASGTEVLGNLIGTDKSGTAALGNGGLGVRVSGDGNTIGDSDPSDGRTNAANTIAFNGNDGVDVGSGDIGNSILGNSIFSNDDLSNPDPELGIDLSPNGPTANDPGDGDTGANNL